VLDDGQYHRTLNREPVQGLLMVGGMLRGDPIRGRRESDRFPRRVQQSAGGVGGVQVVVEDAPGRGEALLVGVDSVGQVGGVSAQEVVRGVPADCATRRSVISPV